jgi:hypothetical protein
MATRKSTDIVQLKLRLPESLRRNIERNARKSGRSLNGELVHQLQKAYTETETDLLEKTAQAAADRAVDNALLRFAEEEQKTNRFDRDNEDPDWEPPQGMDPATRQAMWAEFAGWLNKQLDAKRAQDFEKRGERGATLSKTGAAKMTGHVRRRGERSGEELDPAPAEVAKAIEGRQS